MDKSLSARVSECCMPWGTEQLVPATLLPSQPKANSSASLAKAPPGKDAPHPSHRQPHMPSGDPSHCPSPQPIPLSIPTAHPAAHPTVHPTVHPHCPPHCPSQHKHHARRHRCLIAAQTFSISAILLGLDWNKWHGEILLPPRNPQVSEQWQRDQAQPFLHL